MQKGVDLALAIVWGVAISYRLTTYFVGASGTFYWILGGGAFLFFVIDTSHLKHRFCASACPYAHLQKAFADEHSLHVEWEDRPGNQCGVCVACEKACYVDLNIRATPFSLDCTNCGACIDACNRVFARKKEPSLLRFGFGEKKKTPYKWFVLALFCALCIGSVYAIVYRPAVQFHVAYSVNHEPERVYDSISANRFMMHVRNFTDLERDYRVDIAEEGYTLCCGEEVFTVPPHTKKRVLLEVHRDQEGDHPFQLPITFVLTDPFSGHPLASEKRLFKHRLRVDGQSLPLR
jgi:polyferredoxin